MKAPERPTCLPWSLTAARRGWRFTVYFYGKHGPRREGWRPTFRWAAAASRRAERRLLREVYP